MKIDAKLPIAEIAAEVPGAIGVFESLGLDYSCAAERSLADAAYAEGLDPRTIVILDLLENLEAHIHEYMFLENCILFPRAVAMQEQVLEVH